MPCDSALTTTTTTPHGVIKRFFSFILYTQAITRLLPGNPLFCALYHTLPVWVLFGTCYCPWKKDCEWRMNGNRKLNAKSRVPLQSKKNCLAFHCALFPQYFSISSLLCVQQHSFVEKGKMCADYFPPHQPSNTYPLLCSLSSWLIRKMKSMPKSLKLFQTLVLFSSWLIKTRVYSHMQRVLLPQKI